MWNMERIGLMASEEMSFENVDGRRTDGRRTDGRRMPVYTINSPRAFGSGELKIFLAVINTEILHDVKDSNINID